MHCKYCNKLIEGQSNKVFCDVNCRNKAYRKRNDSVTEKALHTVTNDTLSEHSVTKDDSVRIDPKMMEVLAYLNEPDVRKTICKSSLNKEARFYMLNGLQVVFKG